MSAGGMAQMSPMAQSPSPFNQQYPAQNPIRQPPLNIRPNGHPVNGFPSAQGPPRSGTMGPPSLPANKATDISSLQDSLAGTGVNIDEEDRRLTSTDFYGHPTPNSSFSPHNSFGPYDDGRNGPMPYQNGGPQTPQLSQEEMQRRKEAQENWEEARKVQHPLWKMFLYGENLNNKLKKHCEDANLAPPQNGLYIAAKGQAPQVTRVDGLDNSRRIVSKGEPILKTGEGDALGDILKTICLGAQERLTGIVDLSARLALERRQHSAGKVPTEWQDIAVPSAPSPAVVEANGSPAAGTSRKRSHAEATADDDHVSRPHRIAEVFRKIAQQERKAEEARLAKRARRSASAAPGGISTPGVMTPSGPETPNAMLLDSEKKVTKKDRKIQESKFSEAQQHKSANETARLATSGALGGRFGLGGKKGKTYSWLSGGAGGSAVSTPVKPTTSAGPSAAGTPASSRPTAAPLKVLGQWDEEKDPGIQRRDVLLVLETDGKAPRSLQRAYSMPEN